MNTKALKLSFCALGLPIVACANPVGLTVQSGSASAVAHGSQLTITVSDNAFLNWQSFNIGPGETTAFIQPSAASVVWNRINDQNPSQIFGHLTANGVVVLMNQSGFYFGPNSFVSAAGLIVSTAPVVPVESRAGLFWQFNGPPPSAGIVNYGQLNVGRGGSAFLIAERVDNHGTISAPEGNIGLIAGQQVLLSERPDGRGLSAAVQLPSGSVDNSGRLIADAGTIALNARVVNQNGLVRANSVRERNGIIELVASDSVTLGDQATLSAEGGSSGVSDGGQIEIKSDRAFTDSSSSRISVAGGAEGGNGGFVEISAPIMPAIQSVIDGHSSAGGRGGRLLLDPTDIFIGAPDPSGSPGSLNLDVASPSFVGLSQIDLQATRNITLTTGTTWDLLQSTGIAAPGSRLTLEAGSDVLIQDAASIVAGPGWSVILEAGRNFSVPNTIVAGVPVLPSLAASGIVAPGAGSIVFEGSGSLETQDGGISLLAGGKTTVADGMTTINGVIVNSGFVRTVGGGSIDVEAVTGDVNAGTSTAGFVYRSSGFSVDENLGGISTAFGGNVNIHAGQDLISFLPSGTQNSDAGSGAFGSAPGDVTLSAGRDVFGHFVVADGVGSITAGHDAGTANSTLGTKLLALSVINGGWTVDATHDILLQEVRDPNGVFNDNNFPASLKHLFDYSPGAYTILNAGDSVQLRGQGPRNAGAFEQGIPAIYPGTLEITAGAGGVLVANDVILFPSPAGQLSIVTTGGGSLTGARSGDLTEIIMSDSGKTQYRTASDFGIGDHAATPVHLADTEPVSLDISGDMTGILLGAPKRAEIDVVGNMINSRLDGQNLHDGEVTSINVGQTAKEDMENRGLLDAATDSGLRVGGDILNRNEFTTALSSLPNFTALNSAAEQPGVITAAGWSMLASRFSYDATTGQLTFQGRMTGSQLQALLSLQVPVLDGFGQPQFDALGNLITQPAQFASAAVINALYNNSQDVPLNPSTGYLLGGGGHFIINAHNFDLGSTAGIVSQGPRGNSALANYFTHGADVNLTLSGSLDMFSTTISSLNGGAISVTAGGYVNVGSSFFQGNDLVARGIFTLGLDDVSVVAVGDINVNGSRIAAYDGGNVFVESLTGNVNAGTGAAGSVPVEKIYVDPVTRRILTYAPRIPGSGILATTFPPSLDPAFPRSINTVGDILVETPRGDIIASAGGIVQIPLNGVGTSLGTVTLQAGTRDANGNVIYVGNIDASGSGVIGSTVKLEASGDIKGLVFARGNLDISANQNVSVTALAVGNASVNAGQNISGTIIGIGSVNASGANVEASLLSQNITTGGNVSSSQVGFTQGAAANGTSQALQNDDPAKMIASAKKGDDDDPLAKKRTGPRLARTTGRVTVILPTKQN